MEATSTLADALLDDLDELSDAPNEDDGDDNDESIQSGEPKLKTEEDLSSSTDWWPKRQKRLLDDSNLQQHVEMIRSKMQMTNPDAKQHEDLSSTDPEIDHHLLVTSNQFLIATANDLETAHACLCKAYEPHFPELEELLPDAVQYVRAVRTIGNETDFTSRSVNDGLNAFLTSHQIITLSVAGSTTVGRLLTEEEMKKVDQIASYMEQVMKIRQLFTEYIEQQMEGLAPSICALVGAGTAAKLIALTGGLANLSKIPACNLQVIGQVRHSRGAASSSSVTRTPHQGILNECDLVQRCPRHMRPKALKFVAAKLALAIRCDYVNVDTGRPRTADPGRTFREQIEQKFAQLQEPDKAPVLKALPKPDLTVKKRRGGKRMRRLKERFEETALMKQANTRAFSSAAGEYGDDAMGRSMGLLDTAEVTAGGNMRKNTAEKRKMKIANTRASRKKAVQIAAVTKTSGLASSMVFTPVQGMELVNPDANKERVREANRKWFAENAGFQSALPKK